MLSGTGSTGNTPWVWSLPIHVLAKVRSLNRLGNLTEAMRLVLNTLATSNPEWLSAWVPETWFERYGERFESFRLPRGQDKTRDLAEITGEDGFRLLERVYAPETPPDLAKLEAVETLRRMWVQRLGQNALYRG